MGFSWDLADTMIKASILFSEKHKNHILPGNLNRIRKYFAVNHRKILKMD
jgi:hypothetical protein